MNWACAARAQLTVHVAVAVPVEQRAVEGYAEAALGVVGVADDQRVSFDDGAHRHARILTVLRRHRRHDRHEDSVDALPCQVPEVPVHEFGGEADGVGGDGRQALLVACARAEVREPGREAKGAQQRRPKRRLVPQRQHTRQADDGVLVWQQRRARVFLEQQLFAGLEQVGDRGGLCAHLLELGAGLLIAEVSDDAAALAAVSRHER